MKLLYICAIVLYLVTGIEPLDPAFPEYSPEYSDEQSVISHNSILLTCLNRTLDFIIEHTPQAFIFNSNDYTLMGKLKIIIIELVIIIVWFAIIRTVVKYCWFILRRHQYIIEQPENPNAEPQINNALPNEEVHGQYNLIGEPSASSTSTTPETPDNKLPIELHELHGKYTPKSEPCSSSIETTQLQDKPTGEYEKEDKSD